MNNIKNLVIICLLAGSVSTLLPASSSSSSSSSLPRLRLSGSSDSASSAGLTPSPSVVAEHIASLPSKAVAKSEVSQAGTPGLTKSGSSSSSSSAAIPTSASTYKKECLALILEKLLIPGVAQIVCDYKGTINTHDTVLQWLCNPPKLSGWERFPISDQTKEQCEYYLTNHCFPIARFHPDDSQTFASAGLDLEVYDVPDYSANNDLALVKEPTAPFVVQFFNIHDAAWFMKNRGDKQELAHRKPCLQLYTCNLTNHQIALTQNRPLGVDKMHLVTNKNGTRGISFAGDTSIITPIPTAPTIAIPTENETLRLVVVDHDENMSDPTKNHCFDYWFEKSSAASTSNKSSSSSL